MASTIFIRYMDTNGGLQKSTRKEKTIGKIIKRKIFKFNEMKKKF